MDLPHNVVANRTVARCSAGEKSARGVDPVVTGNAAAELEVAIDRLDIGGRHGGKLPVMEDAGVVQLLDELRANALQLGEIVRRAAGSGEQFERLGRSVEL